MQPLFPHSNSLGFVKPRQGRTQLAQADPDKHQSRPEAALAGPCPKYSEASPKRTNRPQKRKRRPQAAAGPRPGRRESRPKAAARGPAPKTAMPPRGRLQRGPAGARKRGSPRSGQRRPILPRACPSVLSAMEGLTAGFGMGPGVPPPPWPLTRPGAPANRLSRAGTLAASIARKTSVDP